MSIYELLENFLHEEHEEEHENVESTVQADVRYDFDSLNSDKQRINDEYVPDENSVIKSKWENTADESRRKESSQPAIVDALEKSKANLNALTESIRCLMKTGARQLYFDPVSSTAPELFIVITGDELQPYLETIFQLRQPDQSRGVFSGVHTKKNGSTAPGSSENNLCITPARKRPRLRGLNYSEDDEF